MSEPIKADAVKNFMDATEIFAPEKQIVYEEKTGMVQIPLANFQAIFNARIEFARWCEAAQV